MSTLEFHLDTNPKLSLNDLLVLLWRNGAVLVDVTNRYGIVDRCRQQTGKNILDLYYFIELEDSHTHDSFLRLGYKKSKLPGLRDIVEFSLAFPREITERSMCVALGENPPYVSGSIMRMPLEIIVRKIKGGLIKLVLKRANTSIFQPGTRFMLCADDRS